MDTRKKIKYPIIVCDDVDFTWTREQIDKCKRLWINGDSIITMANSLRRTVFEVFALLYDLLESGKLKEREGNMWGLPNV